MNGCTGLVVFPNGGFDRTCYGESSLSSKTQHVRCKQIEVYFFACSVCLLPYKQKLWYFTFPVSFLTLCPYCAETSWNTVQDAMKPSPGLLPFCVHWPVFDTPQLFLSKYNSLCLLLHLGIHKAVLPHPSCSLCGSFFLLPIRVFHKAHEKTTHAHRRQRRAEQSCCRPVVPDPSHNLLSQYKSEMLCLVWLKWALCLIAFVSWLRLLSCVLIWRWEALISGISLWLSWELELDCWE